MRYTQQSEGIIEIPDHKDRTQKISFQHHGRILQAVNHGFGKIENTDFEPLHHMDA